MDKKSVGIRPDRRLAFFAGPKKVSKERTTPAAGISHTMPGCCFFSYLQVIRARVEPSLRLALDLKSIQSNSAHYGFEFNSFNTTL